MRVDYKTIVMLRLLINANAKRYASFVKNDDCINRIDICLVIVKIKRMPVTSNESCSWVTLICNDEYLVGVLALIRSLKRSKTIYPICVLIIENNVSSETVKQIQNEGAAIRLIEGLNPKQDVQNLAFARFSFGWTKLRAFEITDIADKCVFFDSDTIVLNNLDDIFQLEDNPDFAAVQTCICNPEKRPNYPQHWKPSNCPYTNDIRPENIDPQFRQFNSGLFLYHPSKKLFEEMLGYLNTWDLNQFPFSDQDFLNRFYKNKWKCLPSFYNSLKTFSLTHPNIWNLSKIKVIHYILAKPWDKHDPDNQRYDHINYLWWNALEYQPAS